MSLMAHCDTKRIDESAVRAVQAPAWTDTWHPVSHGEVISSLESACKNHGIGIRDREYSLNASGTRMFGVWSLAIGNDKVSYAMGVRNSTDKSMVLGLCAGTKVFVCDNLAFSGSYIQFRKHTGGLDLEELAEISTGAVGGAVVEMEKMVDWQDSLHEVWVPQSDRKELVYDMMSEGVFAPGQFNAYHKCLDEELQLRHGKPLDGAHSLFTMHGAATRLMREWSLFRVSAASAKLNTLCEGYLN